MIPIEVLKRVTVVYCHANCSDGLASAMILKDAFRMLGTSPRIEFLAHDTPEHARAGSFTLDEVDRNECVLFCDISPTDGKKGAGGIVVLDHHKGAEELVRSFGELGVYADAEKMPGVSGAVLAFREVWEPAFSVRPLSNATPHREQVRDFAECVGARDTWQTKDPLFQHGQWIASMLMSKPASHWLGSETRYRTPELRDAPYLFDRELEAGRALFEAHENAVRQAVDQCAIFDVEEKVVVYVFQENVAGAPMRSDVAEAIRVRMKEQGSDHLAIVVGFFYELAKPGHDPRLHFGLRSLNGFDVCAFAKANGGGGHTAAARFSISVKQRFAIVPSTAPTPYLEICERLSMFLRNGTGNVS